VTVVADEVAAPLPQRSADPTARLGRFLELTVGLGGRRGPARMSGWAGRGQGCDHVPAVLVPVMWWYGEDGLWIVHGQTATVERAAV
jgi:hypothetical protein